MPRMYQIFFVGYIFSGIMVTAKEKQMRCDEKFLNSKGEPSKILNAGSKTIVDWPQAIVPYYIEKADYDLMVVKQLQVVFNNIESVSCVKFKSLKSSDKRGSSSWLHFANPRKETKCVHQPVYENNGEILVVLGFECLQASQLLHSVLHGLGLRDEVTHPRRDDFIRILWENIQPEYRTLFKRSTEETNVEYDSFSVMHFHDRAFSANGRPTIVPQLPGLIIKPSEVMSSLDQMKLRSIFGHECKSRDVGVMMDTCKIAFDNKDADESKEHFYGNRKVTVFNINYAAEICTKGRRRDGSHSDGAISLNTDIDEITLAIDQSVKLVMEKDAREKYLEMMGKCETFECVEALPKCMKSIVRKIGNDAVKAALDGMDNAILDFNKMVKL